MPKRWETSFVATETLRDRERHAVTSADEGDPCSRDTHCAGRRIVVEGNERTVVPARAAGAFCPACEGLIRRCLLELPPAWLRLGAETAQMHRRGVSGHSPFGPRLPYDPSYPDLQRAITETLLSWEERVRTIAGWSPLDTQASRLGDPYQGVTGSVHVLTSHLSVLLALAPEPMMRSIAARSQPDDVTLLELGGQDAGEEILGLHRSCLLLLGEVVKQREQLDGVPCRECEAMALERAEPPSDPEREAMWSKCRDCGAVMNRKTYEAWAARYSKWAESAGVACRRCQAGRCAECQWRACSCGASGHVAALCAV